jgi:hypothetical protein
LERSLVEVREDEEGCGTSLACLVALHERPTREVFDAAAQRLVSPERDQRLLGAMILRELGNSCREGSPFRSEIIALLRQRLAQESDPGVLQWVISGLGYQGGMEALAEVVRLVEHPDDRVRFTIAAALPYLVADPAQVPEGAVAALRRLCQDSDADTRWYALTAVVEELPGIDSEQRRAIVAARLDDPDDQIRELAREHHSGDGQGGVGPQES